MMAVTPMVVRTPERWAASIEARVASSGMAAGLRRPLERRASWGPPTEFSMFEVLAMFLKGWMSKGGRAMRMSRRT